MEKAQFHPKPVLLFTGKFITFAIWKTNHTPFPEYSR